MTGAALAADMQNAMRHLHWQPRDLIVAAFGYGDVGTATEVRLHLLTGCQLTCPQSAVLVATLNDALMTADHGFRVDCHG